jgi:AbiV family abortive infection protein
MQEFEKLNSIVQACLINAERLLGAAQDARKPERNHITYHLAALALEELGKITMVVVGKVGRDAAVDGDPGPMKFIDDHERKLFWALWTPSFETARITAEQFLEIQSLSKKIHDLRLSSLYVNPTGQILQTQIPDHDVDALLNLTKIRLEMQKLTVLRELEDADSDLLEWFFRAVDDPQLRFMVFQQNSLDKLTEVRGDSRLWMAWLRKEVQDLKDRNDQLLQNELARQKPGTAEESSRPKWQFKIRLMSASHSIRPKPLTLWNKGVDHMKLYPITNERKELLVQFTVPKHVSINGLWQAGMQMSWLFSIALNIGTMGFFWWYTPSFTSRYYSKIVDLENNAELIVERVPGLQISWGNQVLGDRELQNVGMVMGHMIYALKTHQVAFAHYFSGLSMIAKNDLFGQCELSILRAFYEAFRSAFVAYGDWDGNAETFNDGVDTLILNVLQNSGDLPTALRESLRLAGNQETTPQSVTLDDAVKMKIFCDIYFSYHAAKHLQDKVREGKAKGGA